LGFFRDTKIFSHNKVDDFEIWSFGVVRLARRPAATENAVSQWRKKKVEMVTRKLFLQKKKAWDANAIFVFKMNLFFSIFPLKI
jgi:hypothetical protein